MRPSPTRKHSTVKVIKLLSVAALAACWSLPSSAAVLGVADLTIKQLLLLDAGGNALQSNKIKVQTYGSATLGGESAAPLEEPGDGLAQLHLGAGNSVRSLTTAFISMPSRLKVKRGMTPLS